MIIIFPMAGESSRFKIEGYQLPKYMLPLRDGEVVFDRVMRPFAKYAGHVEFIFVFRDVYNTKEFLVSRLNDLRIKKYRLVKLENKTSGQAETVYFALNSLEQKYRKENLSVFNIDTFHNNLKLVNFDGEYRNCDGILEVLKTMVRIGLSQRSLMEKWCLQLRNTRYQIMHLTDCITFVP